jgi:hypothetical protein
MAYSAEQIPSRKRESTKEEAVNNTNTNCQVMFRVFGLSHFRDGICSALLCTVCHSVLFRFSSRVAGGSGIMLRWVLSLPILMVALAMPAVSQTTKDDKEKKTTGLTVGKDLPGPFHPYNVNGAHKDHYHCLVTQTSLDPVVMIFVRDLAYPEGLKSLEEALDSRIEKNPNVRMSSFTVFVSDELQKVVEDDDKRDKIAEDLRTNAKDLKHVVFGLDSKSNLENYNLDENAWATVVLVKNYKVVALFPLSTKEKLNAEKVDEIMREVSERFGATRK